MAAGRLRIGIDTGGTFTDIVAYDEVTGALTVTKTPTTPADPARGFGAGLGKMLGLLGAGPGAIAAVWHGTTIATNQLLEGDLGRLGLITTEGFEFLLEIARQSVPDGYGNSYFWVKPDRIVPAHLVKTVAGRLDHTGAEISPFDEAGAAAVARWFRDHRVNAIGVCLLHSYASPVHEEKLAAVLAREHPEAVVSISSRVLREYREYERAVTTLLDAAVKPRVSRYLGSVAATLALLTGGRSAGSPAAAAGGQVLPDGSSSGASAAASAAGQVPDGTSSGVPFYLMKSNGGVVAAAQVLRQPIGTVLSGPAAGALGAALIASNAGISKIITCDGGGTSTDVAVVIDGEPALTTEGTVGRYPSKIPMVDVVTVGAGGGSVAWVSPEGALKVGPRSAGADPGPLCYGKGGTEVTVTDAHLMLRRIPPRLLGGEVPLDEERARAGLAALAGRLGLTAAAAAAGILQVSAWNQANAVRQVTVQRGLDVRDFTLVTFGGSGSLLACALIDILGIASVLVPPSPGNVSAFGLLTTDVRADYVRTAVRRHGELDSAAVAAVLADLEQQARAELAGHGFAAAAQRLVRSADLRYYGQASEVRVPVPDGPFGSAAAGLVAQAFHAAHRALYGYDFSEDARQQVEWVNLRVTGVGPIGRPALPGLAAADGDAGRGVAASRAAAGRRPVDFGDGGGWRDTGVYWRDHLAAGDTVTGPAIIEEYGATVPVHPGYAASVDRWGNLRIAAGTPASPAGRTAGEAAR